MTKAEMIEKIAMDAPLKSFSSIRTTYRSFGKIFSKVLNWRPRWMTPFIASKRSSRWAICIMRLEPLTRAVRLPNRFSRWQKKREAFPLAERSLGSHTVFVDRVHPVLQSFHARRAVECGALQIVGEQLAAFVYALRNCNITSAIRRGNTQQVHIIAGRYCAGSSDHD